MTEALQVSAIATLQTWGKSINHQRIPASTALALLRNRYGFGVDDVDHEPLPVDD